MTRKSGVVVAGLVALVLASGCTGGQETSAAEEPAPAARSVQKPETPKVDTRKTLDSISKSIPLYAGAEYRDDLTRRDQVMIRNQFGPGAQVFTLASDDSFPQVYHYYTTYLAQFRAYPSTNPYPRDTQNWRTLEVKLNEAMQDPFIPGEALRGDRQVILQVAETEAEPRTVIRYIVAPAAPAPVATASQEPKTAEPVAR